VELETNILSCKYNFFNLIYFNCVTKIQESDNFACCLRELSNTFDKIEKELKPFYIIGKDWDLDKLTLYENLTQIYRQVYNKMEEKAKEELKNALEEIMEPSDLKEI